LITGVGIVVLRRRQDASREVLLVRRATEPYRNEWFTVDGRLEPGELPYETALRELAEETGLRPMRLVSNDGASNLVPTVRGVVCIHGFVAYVEPDSEVVLNAEHTEAGWFGLDDAVRLLPLDSQRAALRRAWSRP
jgi:dATP pyrophosphohydrolase